MTHETLNSQPTPQAPGGGSAWDSLGQEDRQAQDKPQPSLEEIRRYEDEAPEVPGHETGEYPEGDKEKIKELAESPEHAMTREEYEQLNGNKAA